MGRSFCSKSCPSWDINKLAQNSSVNDEYAADADADRIEVYVVSLIRVEDILDFYKFEITYDIL